MIASLSLATDLGMGQPMEFGLRVALLAMELGRRRELSAADLEDVYYLALVKHIGCTSNSLEFAGFTGGDDIALRSHALTWPAASKGEVLAELVRHTGEAEPMPKRVRLVAGMIAGGPRRPRQSVTAHCEAGGRLAERLGLSEAVRVGLAQEQERWDGKGLPDGLAGERLSLAHRFVMVAHDAHAIHAAGGQPAPVVKARAGKAYEPAVVEVFDGAWRATVAEDVGDVWAAVLACEPGNPVLVGDDDLDRICQAFADFTDLKSPFLLGHSTRVAELAEGGARALRLTGDQQVMVRRAGWLHDVGRIGIPNGIWDKPGPLSEAERERVRLHTYYTERVLARSAVLAPLAVAAASHHENLDGTGYHRGVGGAQVDRAARLIRAADCLVAMTSNRPHRPPMSLEEAARLLDVDVAEGRLDADAVAAVLTAAGGGGAAVRFRPARPAGLSEREIEVLGLMVQGLTNKQIGARLFVSPKTVGHHVDHIYTKIGLSSRAGAALFAMEHGLV